jgi:hypothetical protein
MLLFLLLLISSGLMYFYFQKSRQLEHELEKWRGGIKVRESTGPSKPSMAAKTLEPTPLPEAEGGEIENGQPSVGATDMPSPPGIRERDVAPAHTPGARGEATPPASPSTRPRAETAEPARGDTRQPAPPPSPVNPQKVSSVYDMPSSARPGSGEQPDRQTPSETPITIKVPRKTPAPTPRNSRGTDEIGNLLRDRTSP